MARRVTEIPGDLIRPSIAAKLLACHMATIYRLITSGKLRGWRRPGDRYVVSRADVLDLLTPVDVERRLDVPSPREMSRQKKNFDRAGERLKAAGFTVV